MIIHIYNIANSSGAGVKKKNNLSFIFMLIAFGLFTEALSLLNSQLSFSNKLHVVH